MMLVKDSISGLIVTALIVCCVLVLCILVFQIVYWAVKRLVPKYLKVFLLIYAISITLLSLFSLLDVSYTTTLFTAFPLFITGCLAVSYLYRTHKSLKTARVLLVMYAVTGIAIIVGIFQKLIFV